MRKSRSMVSTGARPSLALRPYAWVTDARVPGPKTMSIGNGCDDGFLAIRVDRLGLKVTRRGPAVTQVLATTPGTNPKGRSRRSAGTDGKPIVAERNMRGVVLIPTGSATI